MRFLAILALILGVAAPMAHATIVQQLAVEQMAREADVVVHGKVTHRSSAWNAEKTRIYTVTEVQVIDPVKGPHAAGATIRIRQLGGTVDGITQSIVGNARLRADEEVVLFLDYDTEKGLHYVVGMAQGKFAVDRREGPAVVARDLAGLALADLDKGGVTGLQHPKAGPQKGPELDAFKARIKAALAPKP
ncbi:MAG: hypothetical protein H6702_23040 [Myxococcales bacterium]|nr:hypothetical protein [Myxococcales bacterium]